MVYSGIIFDFDGVLFDSEKHWGNVENPYLRRHIATWKDEDYEKLTGKSLPEVHLLLVEDFNFPLSAEQYFSEYEEMALEMYARIAQPLENLQAVLDLTESIGKKHAIASSSKRSWITASLARYGLEEKFPVIVTAHDPDIQRGKPAPDVYLGAARRLREEPANFIAIEDSRNGVASAKAAGLFCVGLRNGFNDSQDLSEADEIIYGYDTKSMERIRNLLI